MLKKRKANKKHQTKEQTHPLAVVSPGLKKNGNSVLRILGAAFFGFLLGTLIRVIVHHTTPNVLMRINNISFEDAKILVSSAFVSNMIIGAIIIFLTSAVAGFLAKTRGIAVGLLSNFLPIIFWVLAFTYALSAGAEPLRLLFSTPFLQFVVVVLASIFGGLYGQIFYNKDRDLDIDKHGPTIFGVYWLHYLWIAPVVFYPFITAIIAIIYSWLYAFSTDLYFVSHIKLWINIAWWFYFFVNPLIIFISGLMIVMAFVKFWQVMQFKQTYYDTWEKGGKILLYGVATPVIVKLIVTFTINATENMSDPIINDWRVSVAYVLVIPVAAVIIRTVWWIRDFITKITNPKNKKK